MANRGNFLKYLFGFTVGPTVIKALPPPIGKTLTYVTTVPGKPGLKLGWVIYEKPGLAFTNNKIVDLTTGDSLKYIDKNNHNPNAIISPEYPEYEIIATEPNWDEKCEFMRENSKIKIC